MADPLMAGDFLERTADTLQCPPAEAVLTDVDYDRCTTLMSTNPRRIVNCMGMRPRVLITAFRLYVIAIDLDVAPQPRRRHYTCALRPRQSQAQLAIRIATVPLALDLAVAPANHSSYWLSLYSLLATRRLFLGPWSILAGAVDAGGCTWVSALPSGSKLYPP